MAAAAQVAMRPCGHAVSVMGDHAEAVGDGFRDGLPLPWQGPVEKPEDGLGELPQVGMEPVAPHVAAHDAPQTLDGVRVGRVGRRQTRPDAAVGPLREGFRRPRVVLAGVARQDMDHPAARTGALQPPVVLVWRTCEFSTC